MKKRILFYCKHNSCRSQIAEAYLKHLGQNQYEVYSAGLYPQMIHPLVYEVLKEDNISMQGQNPKNIDLYLGKQPFDSIIIVCREGEAECPQLYPLALHMERWSLSDPAEVTGDREVVLKAFRDTRDDIKKRVEQWLTLNQS
jgi:arsenate reductase